MPLRSIDHAARALGRTPEAVRRRARRLGLATPRQPEVTRAGARWTPDEDELLRLHAALNPGEESNASSETRAAAQCSRSRPGSSDRSATPSQILSGAPGQALLGTTEVGTTRKWSPQAIAVTPCQRESGGMSPSHAATMRRHEERRLLQRYHGAGDASAREELVHRFLPLARQLARRYQRRGEPIDDLVQVASLGLLKAIDRFDPARQTALSSFATPTILGELKRYFRDHGWAVRVPRSLQERIVRVEEATEALWREQGRTPTSAEVAELTQSTVEQVLEARQAAGARWAMSLDLSGDEEGAGAPADSLAIDEPGFLLAEDADTTERLMRALTDREREILRLRFHEDLYQAEVAERVGVSTTHVARLLARSIEALRETTTNPTKRVTSTAMRVVSGSSPAENAGRGQAARGPCV